MGRHAAQAKDEGGTSRGITGSPWAHCAVIGGWKSGWRPISGRSKAVGGGQEWPTGTPKRKGGGGMQ